MPNELKLCPFCGEIPKFWYVIDEDTVVVRCTNHNCGMFVSTHHYKTEDEARKAWNRRADNAERMDKC